MSIVHTEYNLSYVPHPNRAEYVLSDELAPAELTRTSFMMPVNNLGEVMYARNARRGTEAAGGHIEPGETALEGAIRETMEEVGCEVADVIPIGYMKITSDGPDPKDERYTHPVGYQQFFAGRITAVHPYTDNEECKAPLLTREVVGGVSARIFGLEARRLFSRLD